MKYCLISVILGIISLLISWAWILVPSQLLGILIGRNDFTVYTYFACSFLIAILGIFFGAQSLKEKSYLKIIGIIGLLFSFLGFLTTTFYFLVNVMIKPA
jgi:membrane protease YdiL (CAAX protease family)